MTEATAVLARHLKWTMASTRHLVEELEAAGVYVTYVPTSGDLCPNCAVHYATERTGFCVRCTTEQDTDRQRRADEEEEARLREEAERRVNAVKTARKRMRQTYLANPRDKNSKQMLAVVDAFIGLMEANTFDEWEEANAELEAAMSE